MKACFSPFLKEYGSSPSATSGSLADAIRIIYGSTLPSGDLARKDLCNFVAVHHEKFRNDFADFQEDTGNFMIDLASTLSFHSSKEAINREYQRKDAESRGQNSLAKPKDSNMTRSQPSYSIIPPSPSYNTGSFLPSLNMDSDSDSD